MQREHNRNRPAGQTNSSELQSTGTESSEPTGNTPSPEELLDLDFVNLATGCDIPISVSVFNDLTGFNLETHRWTLRQIQERVQSTITKEKSALPLLKLGKFGTHRSDQGSLRHRENLITVSGIEGDYDAGEVTPEDAAARLRRSELAALIYTTPRYTAAAPRWRVLVPLSADSAASDREALCARLNGALGGILAAESFNASQSFYFGGTEGSPVMTILIEGQALDQLPDLPAIGSAKREPRSATSLDALLRLPADPNEVQRALGFINLGKGDYHLWITVGQALHADHEGGTVGFELWHTWSRNQPGYKNRRDLEKRWERFSVDGGITIDTLFFHARAGGYGPDWDVVFEDLPPIDDEPVAHAPTTPATSNLRFLTASECAKAPSRGYLIKGLFAPGDLACIFGAPGAGKSLIAPYLGYAFALGHEVFGMRTKRGTVFYVAAEDSHGMRGRISALAGKYGDAATFKLVEGLSRLLQSDGEKRAPDLQELLNEVQAQRPSLIFIDTLAAAFGSFDENSAEPMNRIVRIARALTTWGAAVVLIHHDTKSESGTPRGHSVLNGALDVALHVKKDAEAGIIRGRLTKNRNGTCERDIAFRISADNFGFDDDGDPITFPRCSPLAGAPKRGKRLSPSRQAALDILVKAGGKLPEKEYKALVTNSRAVSGSDDANSRRTIAGKSISELIRKDLIRIDGEIVYYCDGFDVATPAAESLLSANVDRTL